MIKLIQITSEDIANYRNVSPLKSALSRDLNIAIGEISGSSLIQIQILGIHYTLDAKISKWLQRLDYFTIMNCKIEETILPIRFGLRMN